ncbi:tetratricopeptide repeat-containing protein [Mesorhizobium sp. M0977]|uniref:tetratricopeptide repeat-containing protein n=1 Tax=Mesorhizobium sp. M0977 TaxID=2957039 RepID=UPI00333CE5DC
MPSCFVIMGYGEKTDFETGRKLNLDATYHNIIKPAAEAAGYRCIRADEVLHSGVIDIPMYDMLLDADLVIADISASNLNAMFELGVRHALRPRSTIIMAESQFKSPFDVNHIVIRKYTHLGPDIGYTEVGRMQKYLMALMAEICTSEKPDSPIYSLLRLEPPRRLATTAAAAPGELESPPGAVAEASPASDETHAALWAEVAAARAAGDFVKGKAILNGIYDKQTLRPGQQMQAARPRVVRELAFCTYKIGDSHLKADPAAAAKAYEEAITLLCTLDPEQTTDPETLGLWSSVHKRRFDLPGRSEGQRLNDLEAAIYTAERGFLIRQDYYTGINLAYLFDLRASISSGDQKIADRVFADRVRRRVVTAAEKAIKLISERLVGADGQPSASATEELYWAHATIAEALIGLGDQKGENAFEQAKTYAVADWMIDTTVGQIGRLKALRAT